MNNSSTVNSAWWTIFGPLGGTSNFDPRLQFNHRVLSQNLPRRCKHPNCVPSETRAKRDTPLPVFLWGHDELPTQTKLLGISLKIAIDFYCFIPPKWLPFTLRDQRNIAGWKMDPDWRCIPYWSWVIFQPAMLVYQRVMTPKNQQVTGWWFQPLWKILVKMGIFPK